MNPADFPIVITQRNVKEFLGLHVDPDAERFRFLGSAMLDMTSDKALTLRDIIEMHGPVTLDDMRACIDAAAMPTPLDKEPA